MRKRSLNERKRGFDFMDGELWALGIFHILDVYMTYVVCPRSSCSGLAEEWDVNWWRTPPALFTQQDQVDVQ
jgi:hypothetical protein